MVRSTKGVTSVRVASFLVSFIVPTLLVCAGCSAKEDPPEQGNLDLNFPTVESAVVTETMSLYVFDASGAANRDLCQRLVATRTTAPGSWGAVAAMASVEGVRTCDVYSRPNSFKIPEVSFGDRAVAVVGFGRNGQEILVGCTPLKTGQGNFGVPLTLAAIRPNDLAVLEDATTCTTLSARCSNQCQ